MKVVIGIAGGVQLGSISAVYRGRSTCIEVDTGGVQLRSTSVVYRGRLTCGGGVKLGSISAVCRGSLTCVKIMMVIAARCQWRSHICGRSTCVNDVAVITGVVNWDRIYGADQPT